MPRPIDHRPRQHRPVLTHDQRSPRRRCSLHDRPARGGGYPRALRFQNDNFVGCTAGIRGLRRARGGGLEAQPPQHGSSGAARRRRRLVGFRGRADPPQPAAEGAVRRRWRRRGEAPAAACVVAARARGRRASDACMLPGELGAGVPQAAQLTRVVRAAVRCIRMAGHVVVPVCARFCCRCERLSSVASAHREGRPPLSSACCCLLLFIGGHVWYVTRKPK
mmetsp:Transcript_63268/g.168510  ORF Transcript_63268/g.168510 Transcript_63268/m.168510 type:complete len:221 (+) Transcript_63268:166-828(+)